MDKIKKALAGVAVLGALTVSAPVQTAQAADPIGNAVAGLKSSHVYVDPAASPTLSDATQVTDAIGSAPIYVAVIPDTGSGYDALPQRIGQGVGQRGVYAVISGKHFRAGSSGVLGHGQAGQLASQSFQNASPAKTGSLTPLLLDFVHRVQSALQQPTGTSSGTSSSTGTSQPHQSHAGAIIASILGGLAALAALIFGALGLSRRRKRREAERAQQEKFEQAKRTAMARYSILGDRVLKNDAMVSPNANAKAAYGEAVGAYTRAGTILDNAKTVDDIADARTDLGYAEEQMTEAEAYLDGRDPVAERAKAEKDRAAAAKARAAALAEERKVADAEAARKAKLAKKVTPKNYQPATTQTNTTNNYFGGGYYGGAYYGPGYYADPFWTWVMFDTLYDHDQFAYNNGDYGSYDTVDVTDSYDDGGSGNGGDWDNGSSSSGGDWSSSPDTSSSYDYGSSSSYDSSSSGGDWGGGGGSDSGGGGGGDW